MASVTITSEQAYELLDLLASFQGATDGVCRSIPSLEPNLRPLIDRAEVLGDSIRPLLAKAIATEMMAVQL